jgi:uncharacterized membrane protein
MSLEDLLGGRVLGWIGAVAVLVGLIFLLVLAASRGWIGQEARVMMAAGTSLLLALAGFHLHERRGRTEAALAATATGVAGLFATVVVAGPDYGLIGDLPAMALAAAIGAAATALAIRWDAQGIGWLGLLGALLSPALVGAGGDGAGVALMLTAYVATCAIGLWRDWPLLAGTAFAIAIVQVAGWILDARPGAPALILVLAIVGAATAVSAAAFDWRARAVALRVGTQVLLALNAAALAGLGAAGLWDLGETATTLWLAGLALAHVVTGVAARLERRVTPEVGLTAIALGVLLGDIAFASLADGLPLVAGWAVSAVGFAAVARFAHRAGDATAALTGVGGHLLLGLATAFTGVAQLGTITGTEGDATALAALASLGISAWAAARLVADRRREEAIVLDGLALAALAGCTAIALDGAALTVALVAEAVAVAGLARRSDPRAEAAGPRADRTDEADGSGRSDEAEGAEPARAGGDPLPLPAAIAFLGAALGQALYVLAPPEALADGLADLPAAALALTVLAGGALLVARAATDPWLRGGLIAASAVFGLFLASAALVTPFEGGSVALAQQGQMWMSALWALTGVVALVGGLVGDRRPVRAGALALLAVTTAKVFLVDLAALDSVYRVGSFVAFGLLLLAGAFAWQRLRALPAQYPGT